MNLQRLFELFLPTILAVGGVVYSTSEQTSVLVERIDSLIKIVNKHDNSIDSLESKVYENSADIKVLKMRVEGIK